MTDETLDPEVARPASQPVHGVAALRDVRIPVGDGLELSVNLWLPVPRPGAAGERYPAILEMIPYRKDDWRGSRLVLPTIPLDGGADALTPVAFKTTPAGLRDVGGDREETPVWRITQDVIDARRPAPSGARRPTST
jgi:hypothetical protein